MQFNPENWIGESIEKFEKEFGERGPDYGSGMSVFVYTINDEEYSVSVENNGEIVSVTPR